MFPKRNRKEMIHLEENLISAENVTAEEKTLTADDISDISETEAALEYANARADALEARLACIEQGVPTEYAEDVLILAMREEGEVAAAVSAVLEKYPFFRGENAVQKQQKLTTGIHFPQPVHSKSSGVEAAFRRANPHVKF